MSILQNTMLPLKDLDASRVRIFEREIPDEEGAFTICRVYGMLKQDDSCQMHSYAGFNQFTCDTIPIPSASEHWIDISDEAYIKKEYEMYGYNKSFEKFSKRHLIRINNMIKSMCDVNQSLFVKPEKPVFEMYDDQWTLYETMDNYNVGFHVYVHNDHTQVHVYGRTRKIIPCDLANDDAIFDTLIDKYEPSKIFIGKSPLNDMTKFSGGHGDQYDGNTILLRISHRLYDYYYIYLGDDIRAFHTREPIIHYVSSVGNNCVPYPYAESEHFVYNLWTDLMHSVSDCKNREIEGYISDNVSLGNSFSSEFIADRGIDDCTIEQEPQTEYTQEYHEAGTIFYHVPNTSV